MAISTGHIGSVRIGALAAQLAVVGVIMLAACDPGSGRLDSPSGSGPGVSSGDRSPDVPPPVPPTDHVDQVPDAYRSAISPTRSDPVYPQHGDPTVDALHYDLDLTWWPERRLLVGHQTLTLRATADSDAIPLELGEPLALDAVLVDGAPTEFARSAEDLEIEHALAAGDVVEVVLRYRGTPQTVPAPTDRADFAGGVGWTITDDDATWTLQEPYGAFTWYAANDHPSDKALYDFTLTTSAPEGAAPWTGVANGENTSTVTRDGRRTTTWHLAEPAASYLVTVAFGEFQVSESTSASGVPIQIWAPADGPALPGDLAETPEAMTWVEDRLGPYPFDSFGILVLDAEFGMETQTMVTLGNTPYSLGAEVIVHELVHHWYGDTVSPADWSEVWMNEGMAMYLQGVWEAEQRGISVDEQMDEWADYEEAERAGAGPPAAYDPEKFGAGNIYFGPALMWHELSEDLASDDFEAMLGDWPASQENDVADRTEYWSWIEETTGEELDAFFEAWLLGDTTPDRD